MLEFDSRDGRYHGQWLGGQKFSVDAEVMEECVHDYERERGVSEEEGWEEGWEELRRPANWTEDMDSVEVEPEEES